MPRKRRSVELAMLIFALVIALGAWANVGLAHVGHLPPSLAYYGAGFAVLALVAHGLVRYFTPYADPLLLPSVVLLNGLGLVLIHRLDLTAPSGATGAPGQLMWTGAGIALFVTVLIVIRDHRVLGRYTYTLGALGLFFLALPGMLPASISEVNGAKLWIRLGPFSIQPAEFAKIALLVFFAGYLGAKRDVLSMAGRRVLFMTFPRGRDLGPVLVAWLASLGVLVFERDLGTSLLFFGIFVMMLYVATQRKSWLLIGGGLFVSGALVASQLFGHVQERLNIWLHPFAEPNGDGYQLVQSLFGLAAGGLLGTGLGQGQSGMFLDSFAKTDFIMTTLGEELGLTGFMAVLVLYGLIVERGLRTALSSRDPFGKMLAAGLSFALALQVFVVVGGVTRLIPLTGLTTPFMSMGGSSLVANWAIIAILLRISDAARRPSPQPIQDEGQTQVVSL